MPRPPRFRTSVPDEIAALEDLGTRLDATRRNLEDLLRSVERLIATTDEPPLMPNYQRAAEQLRVAINAAGGARRSLLRRLDVQRSVSRRRD